MIQFPTKDEITQMLVTNLLGPGKTISDLSNQWVMKHLLTGLREAIYLFVVALKLVYDQLTVSGAKDTKLDELGYEYGVDRKQATKSVHQVTLKKSSNVTVSAPVPDLFLVTSTPNGSNPPIQYRVKAGQAAFIPVGQSQVNVQVECTQAGIIGNVPNGAINLVAQSGFDSVTNSTLITAGTDKEDDESYRARILERKRHPERGGVAVDYKIWAESVEGVVTALVLPKNRGAGTVDIVITGVGGIPSNAVVLACQQYIDSLTPADIAGGGVQVLAPTAVPIAITIASSVWSAGYTLTTGKPIVQAALEDYIFKQANADRVVRLLDLITVAKNAYDSTDLTKKPVLVDFTLSAPTSNRILTSSEMSVPGTITIT